MAMGGQMRAHEARAAATSRRRCKAAGHLFSSHRQRHRATSTASALWARARTPTPASWTAR
eukprot:2166364-Prymnesium_polylepis.3